MTTGRINQVARRSAMRRVPFGGDPSAITVVTEATRASLASKSSVRRQLCNQHAPTPFAHNYVVESVRRGRQSSVRKHASRCGRCIETIRVVYSIVTVQYHLSTCHMAVADGIYPKSNFGRPTDQATWSQSLRLPQSLFRGRKPES